MKTLCLLLLYAFSATNARAQEKITQNGQRWIYQGITYDAQKLFTGDSIYWKRVELMYQTPSNSLTTKNTVQSPNKKVTAQTHLHGDYTRDKVKKFKTYYCNSQSTDNLFALAILNDCRMLTTDATLTKKDGDLFQNLYLFDPPKNTSVQIYTGTIGTGNGKNSLGVPNGTFNADGTKILIRADAGYILVDVLKGTAKLVVVPEVEAGFTSQNLVAFFVGDKSVFCVSGYAYRMTPYQSRSFLMAFSSETAAHVATLNNSFTTDYTVVNDKTYAFNTDKTKAYTITFPAGKIETDLAVVLDTSVVPQNYRQHYFQHIMNTPQGDMLAMVPNNMMSMHVAPMYLVSLQTGRKWRQYDVFTYNSAEQQRRDAENAAYAKKQCADGERLVAQYEGLSYNGPNGRTYLLDYDCKNNSLVVGYFKYSLVYGTPGKAKKMPHHYINIERGGPQSFDQLTDDGKRVCTACHGTPVGTSTVNSLGWTKRYVLGAVYYIKDDVINTRTDYTMCGVCRGAGTVGK